LGQDRRDVRRPPLGAARLRDARLQRRRARALHRQGDGLRRAAAQKRPHLRRLVAMADGQGRPAVSVRPVNCPNCGAATAVRTFGHAVNVVCQSCRSILDAKDPGVAILQQYKEAVRYEPLIPLGTRGKILRATSASGPQRDADHEVVGFQVRQILVDGVAYQWREYLLFNPYYGFHYLTEYGGHWNVVTTLRSLPEGGATPTSAGSRSYHGQSFRHFQTANARTVFVLGEF